MRRKESMKKKKSVKFYFKFILLILTHKYKY